MKRYSTFSKSPHSRASPLDGLMSYSGHLLFGDLIPLQRRSQCIPQNQTTGLYKSSSSCHAVSTDLFDPLLPPFSIVHRFRQVFKATFCIGTELLYVGPSSSSSLYSSMRRGPQEYVTYKFVPTSPAVSHMSGLSNLDTFVMSGKWPYSCCIVGCCLHDFFNIACSILV